MKAIELPNIHEAEIVAGTKCSVSGWGTTDDNNPYKLSDILRVVTVPIINRNVCENSYLYHKITPRMICAGNYEQGGKDCKKFVLIVICMAFIFKILI